MKPLASRHFLILIITINTIFVILLTWWLISVIRTIRTAQSPTADPGTVIPKLQLDAYHEAITPKAQ